MPTFRSLGVHPSLKHRLATESITTSIVNNNEANELSEQQKYHLIDTPQSLLSRNPSTLRILSRPLLLQCPAELDTNDGSAMVVDGSDPLKSKTIPHQQALKLRQDVAVAAIHESRNGKRVRQIRNVLHDVKRSRRFCGTDTCKGTSIDENMFQGVPSALELLLFERISSSSPIGENRPQKPNLSYLGLPTGCAELDAILSLPPEHINISNQLETMVCGKGLPFYNIAQFCGPPSTGKTQIALQLACSPGLFQTWYISSNPAVHVYATRLRNLASEYRLQKALDEPSAHLNDTVDNSKESYVETVLKRTLFSIVTDEYDVLKELSVLESFLSSEIGTSCSDSWKPILLVIDSCSGFIHSNSARDAMLIVAHAIKRLTRMYGLATVLINGTVANRIPNQTTQVDSVQGLNNEVVSVSAVNSCDVVHRQALKPALGLQWWKASADIHVWIDWFSKRDSVLCATLERHPTKGLVVEQCQADTQSTSAGTSLANRSIRHKAMFRVSSSGIHDVSLSL